MPWCGRLIGGALAFALSACTIGYDSERARMVTEIRADAAPTPGLANDPYFHQTVSAIARLHREAFVPKAARGLAYLGSPIEIGWEQTISDPYIMAVMTAAAKVAPGSNVLEVGTGSGYQAAMLAELGARISTIEILAPLAKRAAATLRRLGYRHIATRTGDGFAGWPERAPFDAILVTAGSSKVPAPLLAQLKPGGRIVMPIGPSWALEQIEVLTKTVDGDVTICSLGPSMFVPLTGKGATPDQLGLYDRTIPLCYGARVTRQFYM